MNKFYFQEKEIPVRNILSGATAMIRFHKGFIAILKKAGPNVVEIRCVVQRKNLFGKN